MTAGGTSAMDPERWARIRAVFHDALDRAPAERALLLDRACAGDPALRQEVEALLADAAADDSLAGARAAVAAAAAAFGGGRAPGDGGHETAERLAAALAGRYAVLEPLGRGGTARVFLAHDLRHRRRVALKVLDAGLAAALGPERFLREIETAAGLSHPHVLPLFDSGSADGLLYFVMPHVPGGSLRDRLARPAAAGGGRLPVAEVLRVTREVAEALDYAHRHGVVHRDVKPENVLLDEDGHALVADFGIARAARGAAPNGSVPNGAPTDSAPDAPGPDGGALTGAGVVIGTPAYMSPEQSVGREQLDGASDQYSLACVAFELLTGGPAFAGTSEEIAARRFSGPPPTLPVGLPGVPAAAHAALRRAMATTPADRFPSVAAFAAALAGGDAPVPAPAPGAVGRRSARAPRRGALAVAALALLTAGALGFRARTGAPGRGVGAEVVPPQAPGRRPRALARVLVRPFENRTGDPALDRASLLGAESVVRGLAETGLAEAVGADTPGAAGVDLVVIGRFDGRADSVAVQLQVADARDGTVLRSVTVERRGATAADPTAATAVRERALGALATVVDPRLAALAAPRGGVPPTYAAYVEFVEGLDAFYRLDRVVALGHLLRARDADPAFRSATFYAAVAYAWLGEFARADALAGELDRARDQLMAPERVSVQWLDATLRGDLAGAYQASRELARLAPRTPAPLQHAEDALALNRVGEAVRALDAIDPDGPGLSAGVVHWHSRAWVHHMAGDYAGELDAVRRGLARYPPTVQLLRAQARALAALGRAAEVGPVVDAVAALPATPGSSPGGAMTDVARELGIHGEGAAARRVARAAVRWHQAAGAGRAGAPASVRAGLAQALYAAGDWNAASDEAERLLAREPRSAVAWTLAGATAIRRGDRRGAARADAALDAMTGPYLFGQHTYGRARIAALLGDPARALRLLREAAAQGAHVAEWVHDEADFDSLRADSDFRALVRPGG